MSQHRLVCLVSSFQFTQFVFTYQLRGVDASAPGKMYLDMKRPHATSCHDAPCRSPETWNRV